MARNISTEDLLKLNLATKYDKITDVTLPLGWTILNESGETDDWLGYYGRAYHNSKTGDIVIANRGSTDLDDERQYSSISNRFSNALVDFGLGCFWGVFRFKEPLQFQSAETFYQEINRQYTNYSITITGFSLGGLLAELLAYKYNISAIAFDPPGALEIMQDAGINFDKLTNVKIILANPNIVNTHGTHPVEPYYIDVGYQPDKIRLIKFLQDTPEIHNIEKMSKALSNGLKQFKKEWPKNLEDAYNHLLEDYKIALNKQCMDIKHKACHIAEDLKPITDRYIRAAEEVFDLTLYLVKDTFDSVKDKFDDIINNISNALTGESKTINDHHE
jgi:hypothetical protein